ncbi:MAG: AMP-binding protein [Pirellulaceae bacterium]
MNSRRHVTKPLGDAPTPQGGFDRLGGEFPETLVELLRRRAWELGDACAYRFLGEDGSETPLSFLELDRRARAIARRLQTFLTPGQRVLLMFPPGLDFIEAFFGCLYAGVLAVPMSPPNRRELCSRIGAILADCEAPVGLTNSWGTEVLLSIGRSEALDQLPWIAVDTLGCEHAEDWDPPVVTADDVAFLQYTSGSTEKPRGVMVSHGNLVHNLELIHSGFDLKRGTAEALAGVGVSWLPMYHDMGLIGGVLESLWAGGTSVLMAPAMFLQRPERWLRAISQFGACVSGAPNFAYDLCVRKIDDTSLESLDLSSWRVAFCGAEPIRPETLERFLKKFASCGFREDAFYPCYGLAEATLFVTGNEGPTRPTIGCFRRSKLQSDGVAEPAGGQDEDVRRLVGCGKALLDQQLVIADPVTKTVCPPRTVGEIWIQGPSVAVGYWRQDRTAEDFEARLEDTGEGPFLRTGDLGFLDCDELFVTGRRKELLIIRGRNLDPADLEFTAQSAHPALLTDSGAAFSCDVDGEERLVLINELDRAFRTADFAEIFRAVRRAIVEQHAVDPYALILIRPASLPRTTSGKIRRTLAAELYANKELKVAAQWNRDDAGRPSGQAISLRRSRTHADSSRVDRLAEQIERRILEWLRHRVGVSDSQLDREKPFSEHGVDSVAAVELSCELENWLKIKLSPMTAWQYPTPAAISRHLAVESMSTNAKDFVEAETETNAATKPNVPVPNADADLEQLLATLSNLTESEAAELLDEGKASHGSV